MNAVIAPPVAHPPCWHCQHFGGWRDGLPRVALCFHPKHAQTRPQVQNGCRNWEQSNKSPIRLLVCGGADYEATSYVFAALDQILRKRRITLVIHGALQTVAGEFKGTDRCTEEWAKSRGVKVQACPPDWKRHGDRAARIRDSYMLSLRPGGVVALPGGPECEELIMLCMAAGLPVWRPYG
jgi:hypothetical protein